MGIRTDPQIAILLSTEPITATSLSRPLILHQDILKILKISIVRILDNLSEMEEVIGHEAVRGTIIRTTRTSIAQEEDLTSRGTNEAVRVPQLIGRCSDARIIEVPHLSKCLA